MKLVLALLGMLLASQVAANAERMLVTSLDSIGHKWENGKLYVLHKVDKGQTAFAISKRYGTTVDALKAANGGGGDLKIGQIVKVPYSRFKGAASKNPVAKPVEPAAAAANEAKALSSPRAEAAGTHTVEVGNTLYNIALRYGASVADIKAWNGLSSDQVTLGQVLIISSGKFEENNRTPKVSVDAPSDSSTVRVPEKIVKARTEGPSVSRPLNVKSVKQQGLAEKIDVGGGSSHKYLALHRDAAIGTLVQITNQSNQEVIWAKVIGRIPNTSVNDDIVIKLSGSAFDKISPQTRRFRAEITYSDKVD
jgi:LysM repeat protein